MSSSVALGIIGCGRIVERLYLPAILRLPEIRLVAVADPDPARRELAVRSAPGCVGYRSAEELIKEARVSAVLVATPTATHATMASLTLLAGIPVLVEKPLAPSPVEIEGLQAVGGADRLVMVGFNRRFWEPVQRLRDILQRRARPASARLMMHADRSLWTPISEQSDALDDLGCHQLDLVRFLFGSEFESIRARWIEPHTIRMRVGLTGGFSAECTAGHTSRSEESLLVQCDGRAYYVRRGSERTAPPASAWRSALDLVDTLSRQLRRRPSSLRRSYEHQLRYFVTRVRDQTPPHPTLLDGLAVARAMQAARFSAEHDEQEVTIPR